jgi:hypothetical protein
LLRDGADFRMFGVEPMTDLCAQVAAEHVHLRKIRGNGSTKRPRRPHKTQRSKPWCRCGARSLGRADSGSEAHIAAAFCPRGKASGKIHPSRAVLSGAADTRAGDRDGPGALLGSAGAGGWPCGVVAGAFAVDSGGCSCAVSRRAS